MPDRPTDNPGPPSGGDPEKTLHDLLAALANVGEKDDREGGPHAPGGLDRSGTGSTRDDAPDPTPLGELRTALDRLFDLVRAERAEARAEIAELEAALAIANARIRQLEAGEPLEAPAPPPNDFNQLREAAERLRLRTQELFRDAGAVPQELAGASADSSADSADAAATGEPESSDPEPGEPESDEPESDADTGEAGQAEIASIEAFTKPTVLRVFPGPAGPEDDPEFEVESDLAIEDDMLDPPVVEVDETPAEVDAPLAVELPVPVPADLPVEDELPGEPEDPQPTADDRSVEPIEIAPRPARKRRAGLRRRRIDARKLEGVDPATALRAMVSAIDDVWTANVTLDLAIALTDGGTLKVTGGHNRPLAVNWVEPGTPARSTITATTAQLVPLFGRLDLTDAQSAPLIHGPRRDADLLVGWIDRAQRLTPEPL